VLLLALETSCDETSAAVIRDGTVLSNVVSSQTRLHEVYGGVVPELAVREHLRNLQPCVQHSLTEAGVLTEDLDVIAATQGPGLPNALLTGLKFSQGLAFALEIPWIGIHHHEAHLYSPWVRNQPLQAAFDEFQPNISLIVSGGHTLLVDVEQILKHRVIGGTVDDAAGECFDKIAKLIGLPYPGGPVLDQLAREGDPHRFDFPRPMLRDSGFDFSFSGLKTSVRYFVEKTPEVSVPGQARNCASVQAAICDVLVGKSVKASERLGRRCITASGGVSCNSRLRALLKKACLERGWEFKVADPALCTDNAAMIGILAWRKLQHGHCFGTLDADPLPSWPLQNL